MTTRMEGFSNRLKKFRLSAKLSQREAARRIGVPESTYRAWEYGNAIVGEPYPRIAKAFKITLNELFGLTDDPVKTADEKVDQIISELQSLKPNLKK